MRMPDRVAVCFFLPRHHMILRGKRCMMWLPRVTPRLHDGRSIAESALRPKIGTAAENKRRGATIPPDRKVNI